MSELQRLIRVTGTGRISVPPDTAEITVTLSSRGEYSAAVREVDEKAARLTSAVSEAGFPGDAVTSVRWNVSERRVGYQDPDGVYRDKPDGYEVTQILKITVPSDGKTAAAAVSAAAGCGAEPGISVRFTVKDPTRHVNKMLSLAVEDARRKAETLAGSSGVELGRLVEMSSDCSDPGMYSESTFEDAAGPFMLRKAALAPALSVAPEKIEKEALVRAAWEII